MFSFRFAKIRALAKEFRIGSEPVITHCSFCPAKSVESAVQVAFCAGLIVDAYVEKSCTHLKATVDA